MTAKEYLKQAYLLDKQIQVEVKELEQLREMRGTIQGCSYGEKVGSNPNRNLEAPFIKTIEKIWEYEQKIDKKINRLVDLRSEINAAIEKMEKAIELLDAVKESIINAYVIKTGLSRAKLSHLMDAETWMDANKAMELGFADGILYGETSENVTDSGTVSAENSVMFSRKAVNNALVNKLEAKYGRTKKPMQEQAEIKPAEVNKVTDQTESDSGTGRSADELRERLNFIKRFI